MSCSFLINDENRIELTSKFSELPNGTWMIVYIINDKYL